MHARADVVSLGRRKWIVFCSLLVVAAGEAPTASAQGCECTCLGRFVPSATGAPPPFGPFAVPDEAPRNARIFAWLANYDPSTVRLVHDGREIPVMVEPAAPDVPGAFWISATEPIEPPGVYTISVTGPAPAFGYETHFGTLGSADSSAPVTGEARAVSLRNYDSCADLVGTAFELDVEPEAGTQLIYEVEVLRAGELVGRAFPRGGAFGTSPDPGCFGNYHVDGLVEGETLTARVRAWDSAGNVSDFVTFPFTASRALAGSDRPCGRCCVAPAMPTGLVWPLAITLIVVMTRARRARTRHEARDTAA